MKSGFFVPGQRVPRRGSAWLLGVALLSCALLALWAIWADESAAQEARSPLAGSAAGEMSLVDELDPPTPAVEAGSTASHTIHLPIIFVLPESLPLGVQVNHIMSETTRSAADTGAGWVRMRLYWDAIEPVNTTPEHYLWSSGMDQELASYAASNVKVVLTLMGNPDWAATYPAGPIDKVDISELAQFMQAVVARYGAPPYNVKHWEMYNEPDNGDERYAGAEDGGWGYFGDDPQAYVDVLEGVYLPVKAVDAQAQIVFGGMAYEWWEGGPFVESFLDDVLAIMQANSSYPFDVMNFHYYPLFSPNWTDYGIDIIGKTNYIRLKMADYGADKPLICTETSMWSDAEHGGSDELQSRYVPQVYARSQAAGLQFSVWYMLYDVDDPTAWDYGLLDADLNPKPSHQAYLTLGRQLFAWDYLRTLSVAETGSDQIEAYEFLRDWNGGDRVIAAWTNDELNHPLTLSGASLVLVGKYGGETIIYDGDDGQMDGQIVVNIGPSPVYLRLSQ